MTPSQTGDLQSPCDLLRSLHRPGAPLLLPNAWDVAGAHLFVNTYLLGVTTFAAAGNSTYARCATALAAFESEHRVLGQTLAGASPPNDLGFAEFEFDRVSQIAAAARSAGFGFGEQGTAAGRFYDLPRSPMAPPLQNHLNRAAIGEHDAKGENSTSGGAG